MGGLLQRAQADRERFADPAGEKMILVPGFREMHQAMLDGLNERSKSRPANARRDELIAFAASKLAEARAIEDQAHASDMARSFYKELCLAARVALHTIYDEPVARAGARHREAQRGRAQRPRTCAEVARLITALAKRDGATTDLWCALIAGMDREGLDPRESVTAAGSLTVIYRSGGDDRTMSASTFSNRVSRARKYFPR